MATILPGRAAQHFLGFAAHGFHFTGGLVDRDDGRLVHDDSLPLGENQGIRGAQIDREIGGKKLNNDRKFI